MTEPGAERAHEQRPGSHQIDFRALFAGLPTAYLVLSPDMVIVEANNAYEQLLGRRREDLVGRPVFEVFPRREGSGGTPAPDPLEESFRRALATGRPDVMPLHDYPVPDRESGDLVTRYWSSVSAPILDGDGRPQLLVQRVTDVTDYVRHEGQLLARTGEPNAVVASAPGTGPATSLGTGLATLLEQLRATREAERAASEALQVSEQRAHAVLDTAVDAIMTIDGAGIVQSFNRAAELMFGYTADEVIGRNISILMPEPYRSEHDSYVDRYRATGEPRIIGSGREVEGLRRDGTVFPIDLAVSQVGDRDLYTGVVRDITERKALEAELVRQALYDPLTGVPNRRLLMERVELALVRRERRGGVLVLLFIDVDRFKLVNDTLGHDAGDELLRRTADRLRDAVRPEDMVARLGGDEFVVLCDDFPDEAGPESLAHRIVRELQAPLLLGGVEFVPSASVGLVTDRGSRTPDQLLADADAAMYRAKAEGGARFSTVVDTTRRSPGDQLTLGTDLHRALDRGEMHPRYQPVVDLRSGRVVAAEALVRWHHPVQGELLPGAFLQLAHDLGLSVDLDSWMLATSCVDAMAWRRATGRPVAVWVNLSRRSLADQRLPHTIERVLGASGLDPALLHLEITEGALMENAPATARTLDALRERGVQLAIDDFGTGYSSLSYLQQFRVHALKVDRSFIDRLDKDPEEAEASAAIVRAVVNVARALGLRTVAEGVESPEQLAAVDELGCDLGQGFFLGRPAPRDFVSTAIRTGITLPGGL